MIINRDAKPKETIYYTSACILKILNEHKRDVETLFTTTKKEIGIEVNYTTFLLSLNFLFLINKIDFDKEELLTCI